MIFLDIVLNVPINQSFIYSYEAPEDEKKIPEIGKRAEVKFGNRKLTGFITCVYNDYPENCNVPKEKIRQIIRVVGDEPLFKKDLFELAQWISKYYLCSIGEAVSAILPSGCTASIAVMV